MNLNFTVLPEVDINEFKEDHLNSYSLRNLLEHATDVLYVVSPNQKSSDMESSKKRYRGPRP